MEDFFIALFGSLVKGGPESVIAGLVLFIVLLLWERKRLLEINAKKDEKIDKIIDEYHSGNITLADALNSLKNVLFEIKGKIG